MNAQDTYPEPQHGPWSRLWRLGVLHSCNTAFSDNYDGAIQGFWQEQFERTPVGSRIVDIGTGNGALLLLAKEAGRQFELHGVDAADIDPAHTVTDGSTRFSGIRFHPNCSMSTLPFAGESTQLLTSQYAFEYGPRDSTLAEILRVMAPKGRVVLVLHTWDSVISKVSESQFEACHFILEESGIFEKSITLINVMRNNSSPDQRTALQFDSRAEQARHEFNLSAKLLVEKSEALKQGVILQNAIKYIRNAIGMIDMPGTDPILYIEQASANIHDEWQRLEHFRSARLSRMDLENLKNFFSGNGYRVECQPLDEQKEARMGWTLVAENE